MWETPRPEGEAPRPRHPCHEGEAQYAVLRTAEMPEPIFRSADQVSASQSAGRVLGSHWYVRAIRFEFKLQAALQIALLISPSRLSVRSSAPLPYEI